MGGLASDIGGLFGGSARKTDRKYQLSAMGGLNNLFNFGMQSGTNETGQSQGLLGQAGSYYSSLLSGNRQATLGAVAPTVNAANATTDATKRSIASSGTARGGGVNATTQTLEDQKRASIDNAVNSAKAGAAAGATQVGGTMASQAANLLGTAEGSASSLASIASGSRQISQQQHMQSAQEIGDLIFG
jgi:hypothetical protein